MDNNKAIGVLLVSHGDLSKHFLEAARIIYQKQLKDVKALAIDPKSKRNDVLKLVQRQLARLAENATHVIVLCDTYGATASRLLSENNFNDLKVTCVYGMNLPMVLDCINYRYDNNLDDLVAKICKTGKEAIFAKDTDC